MTDDREFATEPNPDDAADDGKRRVACASVVFNAADVDGYTLPPAPERLGPIARIEAVDRFIASTGAKIEHGGERAFYGPSTDIITMPDEGLFFYVEGSGRRPTRTAPHAPGPASGSLNITERYDTVADSRAPSLRTDA